MNARATEIDSQGRRKGVATLPDGTKVTFWIEDEVESMEGQGKRLVFQRMVLESGREQFRFGYYVKGKKGDWVWARSAPMIFPENLAELFAKARARGWVF